MAEKRVMIATPVLLMGGTEIQTLSLVRVLGGAGYRVKVCCYYEFDPSVMDWFKEAGAVTVPLRLDRSNGGFGPSRIWELILRLNAIFRECRPDILHVQYLAPGLVPIIAARLAGISTIFATVHIAGRIAYGWKAKLLLRIAASLCTAFSCVSKGVEEFWFGSSELLDPQRINRARKHFTIYNGFDATVVSHVVDNANREKLRSSLGLTNQWVVGIVGRLSRQKGHAVLLDAMAEVVKKMPNVVLLIVGDGPERVSLKEKAQSLGIGQHVFWLGVRQQKEVFELYAVMDVVTMPSLYEGFGLAAAEAMAAGLPVVGTKIEGLSEIIEDDVTGYLVPTGSARDLATALVQLLSKPDLGRRMGQKGQKRVQECFSMERFSSSVLAAYREFSGP